jgi:hypothetical protein
MVSLWVSRRRVKTELNDLTLTQETSKKEWEGGVRNLMAAYIAKAFCQ